jgi:hypothetical protein
MSIIEKATAQADIESLDLFGGWDHTQSSINIPFTIFNDGRILGSASVSLALQPVGTFPPVWILSEQDKEFCVRSMREGSGQIAGLAGVPLDGIEIALGSHNGSMPPRVVVDGWVIEPEVHAVQVGADSVVSALPCAGVFSLQRVETRFYYEDMQVPGGEDFLLDLPAGAYRGVFFPADLLYGQGGFEFEIA